MTRKESRLVFLRNYIYNVIVELITAFSIWVVSISLRIKFRMAARFDRALLRRKFIRRLMPSSGILNESIKNFSAFTNTWMPQSKVFVCEK